MTRKEALRKAAKRIGAKEASLLLCHHLGIDRIELLLEEGREMEETERFFDLVARAEADEPIEYITQKVSFYGEYFHIAPGALIPRPETELLIDEAIKVIESFRRPPKIAEIGTGSGVIPIILARCFPNLTIVATDISQKALEIAQINAERFGVRSRIRFLHRSMLDGINENFDIILSNPPYIAEDFPIEANLAYEPRNALFGGKRGDELLRRIIDLAAERKVRYLLCEMGYDQREPLETYIRKKGVGSCRFYRDLAGLDRGFVLEMKKESG